VSLIAELKRRKVFNVGATYLVVAWLAVQAASIGFPAFDAPPWALRIFILVALLGFPVSVVLAWVFDSTPDGLTLDSPVRGSKRVFAGAALLAILAIGWYFYGQPSFRRGDPATPGSPASGMASALAAPDEHSIAVLPFVNMSADPAQEYFSDGIAEELLNQLAQSPDLHVAARTSAFQFKGKNLDIADIARQLRVANVLEGSVRRDGTRIRVTAQLIAAASGFHMWSQTFERDAADVFKVQDEIAAAISTALEAKLGAHPATAAGERRIDPAAYDDYLQGRRHLALRVGDNLHEAVDAFSRAIARAPDYAPAYSGRAFAFAIQLGWKPWQTPDEAQASANADIAAALRLDPDAAEAYMVRAIALSWRLHTNAVLVDYEHALKLAPGNVDVLNFFGDFLQVIGALRRAESLKRQAMALDPLAWVHPMNLNQILDSQGRYAEAVAMGERSLKLGGTDFPAEQLMYSQLHAKDLDGARASLAKTCAGYGEDNPSCQLDRALMLAMTGKKDEARAIAAQAAEHPAPEWGGIPPYTLAAAVVALGLDDYAAAAGHVRASFGAIVWYPTLPLLWAQGGAKLPEEMSKDPQWLDAWNDPRAKELMALYRANIAAFRKGE
jgi:TolB-like protein/Tfp pilus assembly protein PilF